MKDINKILNLMTPEERSMCLEAQMSLDELLDKERIEDSAYEADVARFQAAGDLEGLEEYKKHNVSVSQFEIEEKGLNDLIREIAQKYGYTLEDMNVDKVERAEIAREKLIAMKKGYEALGKSGTWVDLDIPTIEALSDGEVIARWREVVTRVPYDKIEEIIQAGKELEERKRNKENIERALRDFREKSKAISDLYNVTKFKLVMDDGINFEITEAIKGMDSELRELNEQAKQIIAEMDQFRLQSYESDFSMSIKDIKETIQNFKNRLKDLKQNQIDKYNARVNATNRKIAELKGMSDLPEEVIDRINNLIQLSTCSASIGAWTDFRYLDQIDYEALINLNKEIAEIENLIGLTKENDDLEDEISWIEYRIEQLENIFEDDMAEKDVDFVDKEIDNLATRLDEFMLKLENSKDNLSPEKYEEYLERANDAYADLAALKAKLKQVKPVINVFEELKNKIIDLDSKVNDIANFAEASYGNASEHIVNHLKGQLENVEKALNDIKNSIEEAKNNGQLDENQYNQLNKMVEDLEKKIKDTKSKLNDPGMVKDADIFALLNGRIDGVEAAIDALEAQIDALEAPIKDKKVRKEIDAQFKAIEAEIKDIEKQLEKYKDKDPEKYEAAKERLNNAKARLEKLGKKYRSKCPFGVRVVKSAKAFFKKYKKQILIAAGLAMFAMLAYHYIIPSIMYGNMMIGATSPALSGVMTFINNILGAVSKATHVGNNIWTLNGTVLNPLYGTSSLLKGLAISGIGTLSTAALVTPLVIAIKKLRKKGEAAQEKITLRDKMKKKFSDAKGKMHEKYDDFKKKNNGKAEEKKNKKDKDKKKTKKKDELKQLYDNLYNMYYKSGMTLDEFCSINGLSDRNKQVIEEIIEEKFANVYEAYMSSELSLEEFVEQTKLSDRDASILKEIEEKNAVVMSTEKPKGRK